MAHITDIRVHGPSFMERIANLRAAYAERAAQRKIYRQTCNELYALSSRELADLGIHRSMIKSIALEAAKA